MEVNIIKMFKLILGRIYKSHSLNANIDNANLQLCRKNTDILNWGSKVFCLFYKQVFLYIIPSTPTSTPVFYIH